MLKIESIESMESMEGIAEYLCISTHLTRNRFYYSAIVYGTIISAWYLDATNNTCNVIGFHAPLAPE